MNDRVTIGLTGDVMLGRTLDRVITEKGYDYPWGNMLPVLKCADINLINLETTLTDSVDQVSKIFNFKASPDKITSLERADVSVANLANNHILDFGVEGLLETMHTLDLARIQHVGAGRNITEASQPIVITRNNLSVGVIGITDNEPEWKATRLPGICYVDIESPDQHEVLFNSLHQLRSETDIVIVSVHWGPNMRERPGQSFVEFAHKLSHHGANVIHGHSAHILQGIEVYNNSFILYDTGDFVDDYMVNWNLRNDLAAYFLLTVNRDGVYDLQITPTRIKGCQVNRATGEDYDWVMHRLKFLSSGFGTVLSPEGKIALKPGANKTQTASLKQS